MVGASGSGKTVLANALMGFYEPNARVTGRIWFDGELCDAAHLAELRGAGIALVPQSVANLDPLMRVGEQIVGPCGHGPAGRALRAERRERMAELFDAYGLDREVGRLYPARALGRYGPPGCSSSARSWGAPRLIIADEPTPGLDLDLAVRALDDLRAFADEAGGVLLITHDIELALRVADRVAVFHEGTVVEETATANFAAPELLEHPFTRALWHALPDHDFMACCDRDAGATARGVHGEGDR